MAIKGITLEIDGDVKPLSKAITALNTPVNKLNRELRNIERSLKFQPGNTELIGQKFEAAGEKVEELENKLKTLQDQNKQIDEQFANKEIGEAQYREFNRELEKTTHQLKEAKKAQLQFSLESDRANSALGRIGDAAGNIAPKLKGVGNVIGGIGSKLMPLSAGMGALGIVTSKVAIDFLKLKESSRIAFTTLLGSAEAAEQMLDNLYTFAKTTPFPYDSYLTAGQNLVAMGLSANDVVPTLQAVTDATIGIGGSKEDIAGIAEIFGKMVSSGQIYKADLTQLTKRGIPAIKILANAYEVTVAEMQSMIRSGEIMSDEALPKLIKGMNEGTDGAAGMTAAYGGMATKMKSTLSGALDSTKSKFRNMAIEMWDAENAYPELIKVINSFTDSLDALPRVFSAVGKVATPVLQGVGNALNKFADFADNASDSQLEFVGKLLLTGAAAAPVLKVGGGLISTVGDISKGFETFSKTKAVMTLNSLLKGNQTLTGAIKGTTIATTFLDAAEKAKTGSTIAGTTATIGGTLATNVYAGASGVAAVATKGLSTAMSFLAAHPIMSSVAAFTALIMVGNNYVKQQEEQRHNSSELAKEIAHTTDEVKDLTKSYNDNTKSRQDSLKDTMTSVGVMKIYAKEIETLTKKEHRSGEEKSRLKVLTDNLNEAAGKTVVTYDEQKDVLSKSTAEIYKNIAAMEKQIVAEANRKLAAEAAEDMVKNQQALNSALEEQAAQKERVAVAERKLNEARASGGGGNTSEEFEEYTREYANLKEINEGVNQLRQNVKSSKTEMDGYLSAAAGAILSPEVFAKLNKLIQAGANKGKQLPDSIARGIASEKYRVPQTVEELNELVKFDGLIKKAGKGGKSFTNKLASQIKNGKITVAQANKQMQAYVKLNDMEKTASKGGKAYIAKLKKQIKSGEKDPEKAVKEMNKYIKEETKEAEGLGEDGGSGYVKGVRSEIGNASSAGSALASAAMAAIKRAQRSKSPSKETMKLGADFGVGYEVGIHSLSSAVFNAGYGLAKSAIDGVIAANFASSLNTEFIKKQQEIDKAIEKIDKGFASRARKKEVSERNSEKKKLNKDKKTATTNLKKADKAVSKAEKKLRKAKTAAARKKAKKELAKAKKDRKKAKDALKKAKSAISKADKAWAASELERKEAEKKDALEKEKAYYEKQASALEEYYSKVENIQARLASSDLLQEKNGWTILNDFEIDNETLRELEKSLYRLENIGIPEDLFQMIADMDANEALKYVNALNDMSVDELQKYIDAWKENQDIAQRIAITFSKSELEELKKEFPSLFEAAEEAGSIIADKISGALSTAEEIKFALTNSTKSLEVNINSASLDTMKSDIASVIEDLNIQAQQQQMAQGTALANALISSGAENININLTVELDGRTVAEVVEEHRPEIQKQKGVQ